MAFGNNIPTVTKNILIINIIMFLASMANVEFITETFALFYPTSPFFRIWQPLTYMFIHGGFWHIFFNMYMLWIFGSVVENIIGSKKFLMFYIICGLGAAAVHYGVNALQIQHFIDGGAADAISKIVRIKSTPTVGASGALYGVLIAYAMLFPDSRLTLLFPPVTLSAKWMVIIFAGIELVTGVLLTRDGIAHFAHLGGMLAGFLLIMMWRKSHRLFDRDKWI